MSENRSRTRTAWRSVLAAGAAVVAIAGMAAVYEISGRAGNVAGEACASGAANSAELAPLARGEVAAVSIAENPQPAIDLAFMDGEGEERRLSEWRGRVVLVNLWATWCAPCRYEMPALDNLQAELGGADFEVVAVNVDQGDGDKPRAFLDEIGVSHLAYYADPTTKVFRELRSAGRAPGLPTTLLIDREGCEIGHLAGPAEWDSEEAVRLVRAAIGAE